MKLYYATGTCSLSPHIVAIEAGIALELARVDIKAIPRITETGADYARTNPNLYVPALALDDGTILLEGTAIVQYLADLAPASGLAPPPGTLARVQLQSWLGFIATELHKAYSPWLFHPEYGTQAQDVARSRIAARLDYVERQLAAGGPYLLGERYSIADAYLYTILGWSAYARVDLSAFPRVKHLIARVGERPAVREAQRVEAGRQAA
ncbi:glutathione S-transferase family protein [Janthinobacterium sp. 1_2014MBL_MicDiv]|uniref:glutathione S-transferase family protein n=1 Tax=Janthinobacterium sp. 1_2014MBL_MicDiv TaxID=1644131 RepID=UPI0008F45B79|nr:glutathione S-transferase family protein [Janthinobacterium sp. 1_2014MBL_MicDiv]APA68018.1 glutathione S-transferase [Janthinobacterium sp. 1_2014MBL_MicDiv]